MNKIKIYDGKLSHPTKEYKEVGVDASLVGKTVEAVGNTTVPGPNGNEPCTVLFFTDKTRHGFVHPSDE